MRLHTGPNPDSPGRWVITKFGPPSLLKWESMDIEKELPEDSVLVRIIVAGIAGSDNIQRVGGYPNPKCSQPGFTPGYELVGEVEAIRYSSTDLREQIHVGDFVVSMCVMGCHALHIVLSLAEVIEIRPADDFVKVAALPLNYSTAFGMLQRSGVSLPPGSSILIGSAAGGVGTAVAQIVNAFDMKLKMYGTCSPEKFDYVRSLGIEPIDRNTPDLGKKVREMTGGLGVDVAYDAVGSEQSLWESLRATKSDTGQVIIISIMGEILPDGSGMAHPENGAFKILASRQKPRTKFWGMNSEYYRGTPDIWLKDFGELLAKVRSGALNPIFCKLHPLKEAVKSNEKLVSGDGVKGKMMFIVDAGLARERGISTGSG